MEKIHLMLKFVLEKVLVLHQKTVFAILVIQETIANWMFVLERILQIQPFVHQKEVVLDLTIANVNLVLQETDAKSVFVMEKNL
jgi:hypothetical protein